MDISKGTFYYGIFSDPRLRKEPIEIVMEIKESHGKYFSGNTTYRGSRLKIKGYVQGNNVYFVEYEKMSGEVLIPNIYEGKFIGDSISGTARHSDMIATFYLELHK